MKQSPTSKHTVKLQKRLNKKINTKDNPIGNETNPTKKMKPKLKK